MMVMIEVVMAIVMVVMNRMKMNMITVIGKDNKIMMVVMVTIVMRNMVLWW